MGVRLTVAGVLVAGASITAPAAGQSLQERLAAASAEAGAKVFRQCRSCHSAEKEGARRVGPNLYGVVGRAVGGVEGFNYSSAMADAGGDWTPDRLDAFLENPREAVPGTRMTFRGLADPQDRANVIIHLNGLSDTPLALATASDPGAGDTADGDTADGGTAAQDFGQLVDGEGVKETYSACTACHSEMIVAQQGKTRQNWDKLLVWMVEEQGMAEIPEPERDLILDYLAEHYNTDRPNFRRP